MVAEKIEFEWVRDYDGNAGNKRAAKETRCDHL